MPDSWCQRYYVETGCSWKVSNLTKNWHWSGSLRSQKNYSKSWLIYKRIIFANGRTSDKIRIKRIQNWLQPYLSKRRIQTNQKKYWYSSRL
jgi:hypothetical protein